MLPSVIPIPLPDGLEVPLPRFRRARQRFDDTEVADVEAAVAAELAKFSDRGIAGKTVAVAVGSRGIRSQPPVVAALVRQLREADAKPFVVPAMGSHGGGTAEGQRKIVEGYGMGEADLGAPLKSSMEVVELARVADDLPVYCDRHAYEADWIVPVNRVKPHTSFRGANESGVVKMIGIGLGKHAGAVALHQRGMARFGELMPQVAEAFMAKTNVLFGVAIVENGYEKLADVELIPPAEIVRRDAELLELAKRLMPRILLPELDVLIVDRIGKDISGAGMDPNVTGRSAETPDFGPPEIHRIVACGLTPGTAGNATGIGVADVTTMRLAREMDWTKTYVNLVTAGSPRGGALPIVANSDREAIFIALRSCPSVTPETARVLRIENTLDLGEVWASEALTPRIEAHPQMEALGELFEAPFHDDGTLGAFHA